MKSEDKNKDPESEVKGEDSEENGIKNRDPENNVKDNHLEIEIENAKAQTNDLKNKIENTRTNDFVNEVK